MVRKVRIVRVGPLARRGMGKQVVAAHVMQMRMERRAREIEREQHEQQPADQRCIHRCLMMCLDCAATLAIPEPACLSAFPEIRWSWGKVLSVAAVTMCTKRN